MAACRGKLPSFSNWHGKKDMSDNEFKTWVCLICGWVYDEKTGSPDDGIAPGTRWDDIPDYWVCPDCGCGKDDFEMVEV